MKVDLEKKQERIGQEKTNNQGSLMKIIQYNSYKDIVIEFQDEFKYRTRITYQQFKTGEVKNPYAPSYLGIGIIGDKYPAYIKRKPCKEYTLWRNMLKRCYATENSSREIRYAECDVCKEWYFYPNFYEWLHSQENFVKWNEGENWHIDKDILVKGNKTYSPNFCCLVPANVNELFTKTESLRGNTPIGVHWHSRDKVYEVNCNNPFLKKCVYLGRFEDMYEGFEIYKKYKENIIKNVAKEEFSEGNVVKRCYEAMMNYEVEITD